MKNKEKPQEWEPFIEHIEWFLDFLRVERSASPNTLASYRTDLLHLAHYMKRRNLQWHQLDDQAYGQYRTSLSAEGYSPRTIARRLSALRSFLKFLHRQGKISALPKCTNGVKLPKTLPKALTRAELEQLMAQPQCSRPLGLRDRVILELLYGTGLRVSELVNLTLDDYAEEEAVIRVTGKRLKTRIVPIPVQTREWLHRYLKEARPRLVRKQVPWVFLNARGKKLSRSGLFRILRTYARIAHIPISVSPHILRHTYAVHLVQAGADLRSVQELLGHESVATTEVYTHLDIDTLKQKYTRAHPRAKNK